MYCLNRASYRCQDKAQPEFQGFGEYIINALCAE